MIIRKIKSKGLEHNSYFLGSINESVVIDPRRDSKIYTDIAQKNEMYIKYIFETHRNEDYTIGSLELSKLTDAKILHGSNLSFSYGTSIKDKDKFIIGRLELEIIETPGHTDESISIAIKEKNNSKNIILVFTGDALFAGDTGRIDLYGEKEKKRLAETLFDSLQSKILPLGENVVICPAHDKGSICGGNISDLEFTTIGYEKENNPQLKMNKKDFIDYKTNENHYYPPYFKKMEFLNQNGVPLFYNLPMLKPLFVKQIKKMKTESIQLVDIRSPTSYASGHVPGSLNIWRDGIPMFAGWFLDYEKPIILIDDFNLNTEEIVRYLIRLGYNKLEGFLRDGFSSWYKENEKIEKINTWAVPKLKKHLNDSSIFILDVREKHDRKKQGYISNSKNIFVGELQKSLSKIPHDKKLVIYCDSGFKTSIAASILKHNGYTDITNILGGLIAWKKAGYNIENTTMEEK
jgi:hydroxyacylglutathione hydrolase